MNVSEEESRSEYTASLRVASETLTAAEIARRLGPPTSSHERGEERTGLVLAFLEARREEIEAIRGECDIDIFCGVFANDRVNCGFVFEPDLSRRLAEMAIPIAVCCY